MEQASLLETTAEVAIAFAGFISIFLVLARRDGTFTSGVALRIRVIVLSSVACVFFAAFPLLMSAAGLSSMLLWRFSSLVSLLACLGITAHVLHLVRQLPVKRPVRSPTVWAPHTLNWLAVLLLLSNVVGWPMEPSAGPYVISVWLILGVSAVSFVVLVFQRVL